MQVNYKGKENLEFDDLLWISEKIIEFISNDQDVIRCFNELRGFNKELYDHSANVAFLSLVMGIAYYKDYKKITELFIAALLHDYGKIFISKKILEKPDTLTKAERNSIELHSIMGYIYLKQHTDLSMNVLYGILDHHEKADGSGYILCKKSRSISNYAKIIAIADVYDSMVSDRVYRQRISSNIVKEYLYSNTGNHFSLSLTDLFFRKINDLTKKRDLEYMEQQFKKRLSPLQLQFI